MNEKLTGVFHDISLEVGGSHYPTINPDLQRQYGQKIVARIIDMIDKEMNRAFESGDIETWSTLSALALEILDHFDLEIE